MLLSDLACASLFLRNILFYYAVLQEQQVFLHFWSAPIHTVFLIVFCLILKVIKKLYFPPFIACRKVQPCLELSVCDIVRRVPQKCFPFPRF